MERFVKCKDCWWFNQRTETTGWCIYWGLDRYIEFKVDKYTCFKNRELCNRHMTLKELCEKEDIEYIDYIKDKQIMGYNKYKQCIPYEGNEHLLGTTDGCDDYYKL